MQSSVLVDQEYTITDANADPYTHASFVIEPDYCQLIYTYTTTDLFDADNQPASVLTYDEPSQTFSFYYDKDLAPVDQPKLVVTLTASSASMYGNENAARTAANDFDVVFLNPCIDTSFVQLTATEQANQLEDEYSSSTVTFTYNPFQVSPDICPVTVTCVDVTGPTTALACQELSESNQLTWVFTPTDYSVNGLQPGGYTYTFDVSTGDAPGLTQQFTVELTLVDPCDPPDSLAPVDLIDQSYTITADPLPYTHAEFDVQPAYCPLVYTYSIDVLANGDDSAITHTERDFSVHYVKDLVPLGQVLKVEVTARSRSVYITNEAERI